jgi:hypothetical protein
MERLTDMAVFARVVDTKSLTAAGKELHTELNSGRLKAIFANSIQSDRVVRVYYSRSRHVPRKIRVSLDILRHRYRGRS